MRFLSRGLFLLCVISLIVFLPATSVRLLATNYFLKYEFKKLDISQESGLSEKELEPTGNKILKFLTTNVSYQDTKIKLFNKREISHLYDVKGVFRKTFFVQKISGAYLIIYLLIILLSGWFNNRKMLKSFFTGSLILVFSIIGLFIFSFFNFDEFFTQFHLIFFIGNSWIFSSSDKLIQIFPGDFWFDASVWFVLLILIESALVLISYLLVNREIGKTRRRLV